MFTPIWGRWTHFDDGLVKPPTKKTTDMIKVEDRNRLQALQVFQQLDDACEISDAGQGNHGWNWCLLE